ncbi:uncharacterized protein MELLADRAFT_92536 [Melampsora larici-populina 98AG31]|uniref:C2H2-type domain-containing protein n=1 Tax=Melampsora larici-populina (strain 98AG31 / pathotype 3-4-7) TaxID=747676 RepID=F4S1W8_MELLP|nr:uncharacterized protein MELLADRAFT_92536 [Melampsora larici-populina 98AG31]EGG01265.1 hypothetical protein MELLADRAFT_92536 [Melampsora larici-populina 98AG31]
MLASPSQNLYPTQPTQLNWEPSTSDNLLNTEAWTNSFNLIGFNPSDLMESAFQDLNDPVGPLEVEHHQPPPVEDYSNTVSLPTEQVKESPAPTSVKRKRSASYESADESSPNSPNAAKIFACVLDAECFEKFSRVEHLARHERKHTKEKPFECHCLKAFTRLDNWRQHKNTVHKHLVVENAKTEKSLVEVQKELRRMNKLRKATIMAATKQAKLDAMKQAEREHECQPKAKKPSLAPLVFSGPSTERVQQKSPVTIQSTPLVPSAVGGNQASTLDNSNITTDYSSIFTSSTMPSSDIGFRNSDFTPHHANSSSLSDFSTSPFTTPMDISRVIPFGDMSQSLSDSAPPLTNFQTLLEPFSFFSNSPDPTSFPPLVQPFLSQSSMMPLTGDELPNVAYQSNSNSGLSNQFHLVEYDYPYDITNLNTSLYPSSLPSFPSLPVGYIHQGSNL